MALSLFFCASIPDCYRLIRRAGEQTGVLSNPGNSGSTSTTSMMIANHIPKGRFRVLPFTASSDS